MPYKDELGLLLGFKIKNENEKLKKENSSLKDEIEILKKCLK
jgi:hypothetical protein